MRPVLSLRPFLFTPFSHDNSIIKINPWNRGSTPIQVRKPFEFGVVCSNLMYWARPATEQLKVNATKFQWVSFPSLGYFPWQWKIVWKILSVFDRMCWFHSRLECTLFRFFCFVLFYKWRGVLDGVDDFRLIILVHVSENGVQSRTTFSVCTFNCQFM